MGGGLHASNRTLMSRICSKELGGETPYKQAMLYKKQGYSRVVDIRCRRSHVTEEFQKK